MHALEPAGPTLTRDLVLYASMVKSYIHQTMSFIKPIYFREINIMVNLINWSNEWKKKSSCLIYIVTYINALFYIIKFGFLSYYVPGTNYGVAYVDKGCPQ